MRRRRWLPFVIGIPLLLLLIAAAIIVVSRLTSPSPSVQATPTVVSTRLPAADVTRLEKALNSPDRTVQATVLMPGLATAYLQQGKSMFPVGSTVRVEESTSICKNISCEVDAIVTPPGGKQVTLFLYLDHSYGQWLITGTSQK